MTVLPLHQASELAAGLRPTGPEHDLVTALAEHALESGSAESLCDFLSAELRHELERRLAVVAALTPDKDISIDPARAYAHAMLAFQAYSQHMFAAVRSQQDRPRVHRTTPHR
jgi:hypothetical protein